MRDLSCILGGPIDLSPVDTFKESNLSRIKRFLVDCRMDATYETLLLLVVAIVTEII